MHDAGDVVLVLLSLAIVINAVIWWLLIRDWLRDRRNPEGLADAPGRRWGRDRGQG